MNKSSLRVILRQPQELQPGQQPDWIPMDYQSVLRRRKGLSSIQPIKPLRPPIVWHSQSTISGRFVATVPNEGLPQVVILVNTATPVSVTGGEYKVEIEVKLINVVGEALANSLIEFNFDQDGSDTLNGATTYTLPRFGIAEVRTDGDGVAKTDFFVTQTDYDADVCFLVSIGTGSIIKSVSICKQ